MPETTKLTPPPADDLDSFWIEAAKTAAREGPQRIEDAAKQLISITTIAQTIYFAALSLAEKPNISQLNEQKYLYFTFLSAPIVLWIITILFCINVFNPKRYSVNLSSPEMAADYLKECTNHKLKNLRRAYFFLAMGFVFLVVSIFCVYSVLFNSVQNSS